MHSIQLMACISPVNCIPIRYFGLREQSPMAAALQAEFPVNGTA